jgi:surfactin synthase thioesterase subunit
MTLAQDYDTTWIRRFQPSGIANAPEFRLFCFPHAGGAASYYFPYGTALAPRAEVLAVQYPGRQDRRGEPLVDDIHRLADHIHAALPARSPVPYAFFGHSMGAVLAFEVAARIEAAGGDAPVHLFVSGRRAPSVFKAGTVHLLDDRGLMVELSTVGGTDPRLLADWELMAAALPVTRSDYRAIERYRWTPCPPLSCPLTALVGTDDPQAPLADAQAWRQHTTAGFTLRTFPGGHFYLNEQRAGVLATVRETMRAVVSPGAPR